MLGAAAGAALLIAGTSCGRPAVCEEITEACHPVDPGSGPIHDCHEASEEGSRAECETQHDACLVICTAAADAGTDAAAGSDAASGTDAAPGMDAGDGG